MVISWTFSLNPFTGNIISQPQIKEKSMSDGVGFWASCLETSDCQSVSAEASMAFTLSKPCLPPEPNRLLAASGIPVDPPTRGGGVQVTSPRWNLTGGDPGSRTCGKWFRPAGEVGPA